MRKNCKNSYLYIDKLELVKQFDKLEFVEVNDAY